MKKPIEDRIVERLKSSGDCLLWSGAVDTSGYGLIRYMGKLHKAHRLSYMLSKGKIPEGMLVCHKCDVPLCCNPDHLFLGTMQDNMDDREAKGRGVRKEGEAHGMSKLTADTVREARERFSKGESAYLLAKCYGVAHSSMWKVVTNQSWRSV